VCVCVSTEPVVLPPILPGQATPIPLHLMSWRLQARPKGLGLFFCKVPIHWTSVERTGEVSSSKRERVLRIPRLWALIAVTLRLKRFSWEQHQCIAPVRSAAVIWMHPCNTALIICLHAARDTVGSGQRWHRVRFL
jgi:hypothetical protein